MNEVIDLATSMPAIVWTAALILAATYWLLSSVLGWFGIIADSFEADVDLDLDADVDHNFLGVLTSLGLLQAPPTVVFTAFALVGWVVTMLAASILGSTTATITAVVAALILVGSFMFAVWAAGRIARAAGPLYQTNYAIGAGGLVGSVCRVRSMTVNATTGFGVVDHPTSGEHNIQIRYFGEKPIGLGDKVFVTMHDPDESHYVVDDYVPEADPKTI